MADTYTVKSGDSLWKIASMSDISLSEIKSLNPQISNFNLIFPGQKVNVKKKEPVQPEPEPPTVPISEEQTFIVEDKEQSLSLGDDSSFTVGNTNYKTRDLKSFSGGEYEEVLKILPKLETSVNGRIFGKNAQMDIDEEKMFNKYNKYNANTDFAYKGINYIFITKPRLNLVAEAGDSYRLNIDNNAFFKYLEGTNPEVLEMLCDKSTVDSSMFIKLLSNRYKGFETQDQVMRTKEMHETWKGYKLNQPISVINSVNGGSFSITYDEVNNSIITKIHKAWLDYIEKVRFGEVVPSADSVQNRELEYLSSLYYFSLTPDGETIQYWAKYVGLAPISAPYSSFGGDKGEIDSIKPSVQYAYSYKEDMEPDILLDFNKVSLGSSDMNNISVRNILNLSFLGKGNIKPSDITREELRDIPNESGIGFDKGMFETPFIATDINDKGNNVFKLMFK